MKQSALTGEHLAQAEDLHGRILTFDSHVDLPINFGSEDYLAVRDGPGAFDLAKAMRGRLSGAALVVHAPVARRSPQSSAAGLAELERRFEVISAIAADYPERAGIAKSPDEFRAIVRDGRFAIVIALQNCEPLANEDSLDAWAERGMRMCAFAFIGNNRWADSARPYPFIAGNLHSGGLTPLGKAGVHRLNDLGVMVDVSQLSSSALDDVLATSRAPVVASHSAVKGIVDADRNLSDVELQAIARNGGVVQIVGFAPYLRPLEKEVEQRLRVLWTNYGLKPPQCLSEMLSVNDPATVDWPEDKFWDFLHAFHDVLDLGHPIASVTHLVDAVDYAIDQIGIDHVGLGSDFNHGGGVVGWMNVGESLTVTAELLRRNYGENDIAKLWGENFMYVWQQVLDRRTR